MNKKYCLVQDDSSHWYCIPVETREFFDSWCAEMEEQGVSDLYDFEEYRLNMHISSYCFENFQEIKK